MKNETLLTVGIIAAGGYIVYRSMKPVEAALYGVSSPIAATGAGISDVMTTTTGETSRTIRHVSDIVNETLDLPRDTVKTVAKMGKSIAKSTKAGAVAFSNAVSSASPEILRAASTGYKMGIAYGSQTPIITTGLAIGSIIGSKLVKPSTTKLKSSTPGVNISSVINKALGNKPTKLRK